MATDGSFIVSGLKDFIAENQPDVWRTKVPAIVDVCKAEVDSKFQK